MARKQKNGVNVSQAIRDYLKTNSEVGPTAAAEAISKQVGKKVSPTYVSNIKSTMNGASKKGRKGRKPGRKAAHVAVAVRTRASESLDLATISAAKQLIGRVGAHTAHQLIDLLA